MFRTQIFLYQIIVLLLGLSIGFGLFVTSALANESIEQFTAEYQVMADGTVEVVEQIRYNFAGNERRGIERILDDTHVQSASAWFRTRYVTISDTAGVMLDDPDLDYELRGRDGLTVRIAYEDPTVTGVHEYQIRYTLTGALSYDDESAELYWNVTGNEWSVPIRAVEVTVSAEEAALLADDVACYQGRGGTTDTCDSIDRATSSVTFAGSNLAVGEQLTVAVALDRELIGVQINERLNWLWVGVVAGALWLLFLSWWTYRVRTKDKPDTPRVTQYEPYDNYPPMYTGVLYNGQLDQRDITAGLIYSAQQGFLDITREESTSLWIFTRTDFTLKLKRTLDEVPTRFLRKVLELVFSETPTVGDTVQLSELQGTRRARINQRVIKSLRKALLADLRDNEYLEQGSPVPTSTVLMVGLLLVLGFGSLAVLEPEGTIVTMPVLLLSGILFAVAYSDRYTKKGREAQHYLHGFKHFLEMTDKRRFAYHNAPERNTTTFMEYLPYAIAFGVEEKWADAFSDIALEPPQWYHGGAAGTTSFQAREFTTSLGSFSQSFSQASGSTGSSGGGSAGGGGGGGGGGSV